LSWPGYFLYPLLSFHALVSNRKYFKKTLLALVILLTTLSLHFGHVYILTGNPLGGGLLKALMFRLNLMPQNGGPDLVGFTLKKLIIQEARWITVYYTKLVVFFGLATAGVIGWKMIFLKKFDRLSSVLLLLLSFGLSYQLVLPNIVFIHDYFNIYFYPYFALSLSFWIEKIVSRSSQIAIVFLVALSLLIYRERTEFFRALENSNMHQTGFTLGKLIAEVVPPGENAVVFSINYADHHGVFINYYADRQISFQGYGLDGWADFLQISSDTLNAFTVIDHRLDNGVIDNALATQAASMSNFGNFNFYRLNQGAKIN
jgi:hypothetical protein